MRLVRIVVEGCLGMTMVAVVALLHFALRSALRYQDRRAALGDLQEDTVFNQKEQLRRPFFLWRADEP